MIQVERKTDPSTRPKSTEQQIKELQNELASKDEEIVALKGQIELVQEAVDEIIFKEGVV